MNRSAQILALIVTLAIAAGCGENQTPLPAEYEPGATPEPACMPNLDGTIDGAELPVGLGIPVRFLVSPSGEERPVDVVGLQQGTATAWDWSARAATDAAFTLQAQPLPGAWFADSFPGGGFIAPVDAAGTTIAVYSRTDAGIWLHGVASAEPAPASGRTLLPYADPVLLYRFPIEPGQSWTSTGTVSNGEFNGYPWTAVDTYEVEVDAAGLLELPDLSFSQAHRLRTRVEVQPAFGYPTSRRMVQFFFECFGEVARATSELNEPEEDFTTATEIRRLGLLPPE